VIWLILGIFVFSNDFFSLISVILLSTPVQHLVLWTLIPSAENFHELLLQLFLLVLFLQLRLGHGSVVERRARHGGLWSSCHASICHVRLVQIVVLLEERLLSACRDSDLARLPCTRQSLANIDHLTTRCSWTEHDTALSVVLESWREWRLTVGIYPVYIASTCQIDLVFDEV